MRKANDAKDPIVQLCGDLVRGRNLEVQESSETTSTETSLGLKGAADIAEWLLLPRSILGPKPFKGSSSRMDSDTLAGIESKSIHLASICIYDYLSSGLSDPLKASTYFNPPERWGNVSFKELLQRNSVGMKQNKQNSQFQLAA